MNYIDKKLKEIKKYLPANKKDEKYITRKKRWTKQIKENGWADYETWSLDAFLAPYIIERLKMFKEKNNGFPKGMTEKSWNAVLDKMILAFEIVADRACDLSKEDYKIVKLGLQLFSKHYLDLWW